MKRLIFISLCVLFASTVALSDWAPGDSYKMHFPQLPDPCGWDVAALDPELADDWLCTATGPVSDIHIWYSVFGDEYSAILGGGVVRIYSNNPCGSGGYSEPNELLWDWNFDIDDPQASSRLYGQGDQGWYDPRTEDIFEHNHDNIYQLNLVDIPDPFEQQQGEIYWLALQLNATFDMGWKTSLEHWNDDAVWRNAMGAEWNELTDPLTCESLDMAFVITPEPATMALLGLGSLVSFRKRRA